MSRSFSLLVLMLFVPALSAAEPAALSGVHTLYLNVEDLSARRDILAALKRELPQVKVVRRMREADAVLEFGGRGARERPAAVTEVAVSNVSSYDTKSGVTKYETKSVTVPLGQPTHDPGHVEAQVTRNGQPLVLFEGLWTPSFPTQSAARFIHAWRAANAERGKNE